MAMISDALWQAFMPEREHEELRDEAKAWRWRQRALMVSLLALFCVAVLVAALISVIIVFQAGEGRRTFCHDRKIRGSSMNSRASDLFPGGFYLTDDEMADYYWMIVFVPTGIVFLLSFSYLLSGAVVACSASTSHSFLMIVENSLCSSKRGGIWCLSVINFIFAIVFIFLAVFLGSTLLTFRSYCSVPLFWCYEIAVWGLVILHGTTTFFLRRKAVSIIGMDRLEGPNTGLEMFHSTSQVTPEMERLVNEGFKSWMGSSFISPDEDEGPDDYVEAQGS